MINEAQKRFFRETDRIGITLYSGSMSKPVVTACIRLRIAAQQAKPSAAIGQVVDWTEFYA